MEKELTEKFTAPLIPRRWANLQLKSFPYKKSNKTIFFNNVPSMRWKLFPPSDHLNSLLSTRITFKPETTTILCMSTVMEVLWMTHSKNRAYSLKLKHSQFSDSCFRPSKYWIASILCTEISSLRIFSSLMGRSN